MAERLEHLFERKVVEVGGTLIGHHDGRGSFPDKDAKPRASGLSRTQSVSHGLQTKAPQVHDGEEEDEEAAGSGVSKGKPRVPAFTLNRLALFRIKCRLRFAELKAILNLLHKLILKPLALASTALFLLRRIWLERSRLSKRWLWVSILAVDLVLKQLRNYTQDPIFRLAVSGYEHLDTKPGLYHSGESGKMRSVLSKLDLEKSFRYTPPKLSVHGDFRTLLSTLLYKATPVEYFRCTFPSKAVGGEIHGITMDWVHPVKAQQEVVRVVLILAGVGGDSNAPYVRDAVQAVHRQGWTAVVVGPRGLGNTVPVRKVEHVFNPSDLTDVVESIRIVNDIYRGQTVQIVLLGFSLGGITVCNLLGRHAEAMPESVVGALSVSGAFRCDMMLWDRYMEVYQPVIVPGLLREIFVKYGTQLGEILSWTEMQRLLKSTTYKELFENFFAKIAARVGRGHGEFDVWKESQEGHEHRCEIRVPLLLFASCDDPLHHPDTIGAESHQEPHLFDNQNVAYWLTEHGGHVAWPETVASRDFRFINRLIVSFVHACTSAQNLPVFD